MFIPDPGSELLFPGSGFFPNPGSLTRGQKVPDPGSGSFNSNTFASVADPGEVTPDTCVQRLGYLLLKS